MVKLFLSNRAIAMFVLPFIIAVFTAMGMLTEDFSSLEQVNFGFLGLIELNPYLSATLGAFVILFNAIGLNYIFNTHEFYERNTYMPSLLYVVIMYLLGDANHISGTILAHALLLFAMYHLFNLRQNEDGRRMVFNAAFFVGLASTVQPFLLISLPFIFFMVWAIRPFVARESILLICGYSIPLIYASIGLNYFGIQYHASSFLAGGLLQQKELVFLIIAILLTLIFILGMIGIQLKTSKSSIRLKKLVRILWNVLFLAIVTGSVGYFYLNSLQLLSLVILPLSFFLTYTFSSKTFSSISTFLFYTCLIFAFIKYFL